MTPLPVVAMEIVQVMLSLDVGVTVAVIGVTGEMATVKSVASTPVTASLKTSE